MLEDGTAVKMAGVSMLENEPADDILRSFYSEVMDFSINYLLGRKFEIVKVSDSVFVDTIHETKYSFAYITKRFPIGSTDVNYKYLEMGYGRFINNVDAIHRKTYMEAENSAYERGSGMWTFADKRPNDISYRKYKNKILWNDSGEDSVFIRPLPLVKKASRFKKVAGELLLGSLFLPAGVLGGAAIGYGAEVAIFQDHDDFRGLAGALIGMYTGAIVGTSFGIYLIAHNYNPRLTFYSTLSAGILGAAAGIGLCSTTDEGVRKYGFAALILPVMAPLIYVNMVDNDHAGLENAKLLHQLWNDDAGSMSFKDIRNRDVMNVNIFHLSF